MKRLALWLILLMTPGALWADGGVVRARETRGSFVITVFSPPSIAMSAPADLSVLVQRKDTGAALLDATVELTFTAPSGSSLPTEGGWCGPMKDTFLLGASALGRSPAVPATHTQATNQLLYAAQVILPARGEWEVRATIRHGAETATVSCALPVMEPANPLATIWPWLALPGVMIALFVLNQKLRHRTTSIPTANGYVA